MVMPHQFLVTEEHCCTIKDTEVSQFLVLSIKGLRGHKDLGED